MATRRARISQVRPRPPSTGRPTPTKRPATRPTAPNRLAPHRRIERAPALPLYLRILMVVAVVALGGIIVFAGVGVLSKVVASISSSFSDAISQVTSTPSPSPSELIAPNAPTLTLPAESYTNQPTVDLTGTVPQAYIGQEGVTIQVYRQVQGDSVKALTEIPVGQTAGFTVPGVTLGKGSNIFTATLKAAGGESPPSKPVTYVLDTAKPKIAISSPAKDGVVNGKTVTIVGKTQARSALVANNGTNHAVITGKAGDDGAFKLILAIAPGPNAIQIAATDPAGNLGTIVINVSRGGGALQAKITASSYRFIRSHLPDDIILSVLVTDPDGHPVDGARVTFTLTIPGVTPIVQSLSTDGTGRARWKTAVPGGASLGQGVAAVLVETDAFGTTTAQTFLTIAKK
jgi:hypothetical protein